MQEFQMVVRINESMFRQWGVGGQNWMDPLIRQRTHMYECRITESKNG